MKKVALFVLFLAWASIAHAAFAIFQVASNAAAIAVSCNFQTGVATGVGASTCVSSLPACNGSADDTASFDAFASWAINTWQASHTGLIELNIPAGLNCKLDQAGGSSITFSGIQKLKISFAGATVSGTVTHLAAIGHFNDNTHEARVQTVSAGATSVTLVTAGQTSLFTVGQWVLIAGFDLQVTASYPINPMFFEFLLVTGKDGTCTGTGTVCFSTPLQNGYKSTWPLWNSGGAFEAGRGPATLYAMPAAWNTEVEWSGGTIANTGSQMDANGRQIVFRNVTFTDSGSNSCVFPSQNNSMSIVTSTMMNCEIEADKLFTSYSITGTPIASITFQTGSANTNVTIDASTINTLVGTPYSLTVSGSTISTLLPGATSFGYTKTISIVTSTIGFDTNPGGFVYGGQSSEGLNNIAGLTMSGGIITIPTSYVTGGITNTAWMGPGANVCWADTGLYRCAGVFQISDVTISGSDTLVHISQSGGLPTWTYNGAGLFVRVHPAVQFTCTSCDSFAGAPAASPLWSYVTRILTNANGAGTNSFMWGNISTISANVTAAYGGASAAVDNIRPNDAINPSTYAVNNYTTPTVNLKQTGSRTLDTSGGFPAVWGNVKSGDTLSNLTSQTWIVNLLDNIMTDLSGDPSHPFSITVTAQTSQGVVVPFAMDDAEWSWLIGDNDNANWRQAM